ncbi:hypothetical protein [Namhaeicola litoreus]|uniref:Transmembrane protein n=1 Tax=Namhaeicola litoreus TaxID=1052145 RepID=A0ABW3Y5R5_9FLAO
MLKQSKILIVILFIAGLLSPMLGGVFHAFQNHEHNYCFAKDELHLHKSKDNCSNFHHIQNVIQGFESYENFELINSYFRTSYFLVPQKEDFQSCDINTLRGPPIHVF